METITLNGWNLLSTRPASTNYVSNDKTQLLKIINNTNENTVKQQQGEYETARNIKDLGIPTPEVYKMVEVQDKGIGIIFQNINNKLSISRAISINPDKEDFYLGKFIKLGKLIHNTKITNQNIPSRAKFMKDSVIKCDNSIFTGEEKEKILKGIDSIPETNTAIHGDFHLGNFITGDEGDFAIDLGFFSYGNPLFDWGSFYLVTHFIPDQAVDKVFHLSKEKVMSIYKKTLMQSYNLSETEYESKVEELKSIAFLTNILYIGIMPGAKEILLEKKAQCSYLK